MDKLKLVPKFLDHIKIRNNNNMIYDCSLSNIFNLNDDAFEIVKQINGNNNILEICKNISNNQDLQIYFINEVINFIEDCERNSILEII